MDEILAISWAQVQEVIDSALAEDMAFDDVTTKALVPEDLEAKASIVVKGDGVLAGGKIAET
ncbi:MAG: nicotinate-nucleotide diphosphorylase (carboxylating), partial [Dehalococcoidia bacterium]